MRTKTRQAKIASLKQHTGTISEKITDGESFKIPLKGDQLGGGGR